MSRRVSLGFWSGSSSLSVSSCALQGEHSLSFCLAASAAVPIPELWSTGKRSAARGAAPQGKPPVGAAVYFLQKGSWAELSPASLSHRGQGGGLVWLGEAAWSFLLRFLLPDSVDIFGCSTFHFPVLHMGWDPLPPPAGTRLSGAVGKVPFSSTQEGVLSEVSQYFQPQPGAGNSLNSPLPLPFNDSQCA